MTILVIYDNSCSLCNRSKNFIASHSDNFTFLPLSNLTEDIIIKFNINTNIDSIICIKNNQVYYYADAIIEIAKSMHKYSWTAKLLALLPRILRNKIYILIAENRYLLNHRGYCSVDKDKVAVS